MASARAARSKTGDGSASVARLIPTQKRSRERFEMILACAQDLLLEKGSDAFRMSDIVERTGVPFGSLYQYFPDKTAIIGTLAERYNAIGHECVRAELAAMTRAQDLHPTLGRITDSFYGMYRQQPVMAAIWQATLADRRLQAIDRQDCDNLAGLLGDSVRTVFDDDPDMIATFAMLAITLIGSAVRYAITLDEPQAQRVLEHFKVLLPDRPGGRSDVAVRD